VYGGDGLARLPADERGPGKTVFVPFVLEGETVAANILEQKRGFARGRVESIVQASAYRVEPHCPYFQRCGGCHYQHSTYAHQLEIKAAILKENLRRTAKLELDCELQVHASPEWNYRNRTRLKVRTAPTFALGYHRVGSNELIPVEQCPISSPLINRAITALWDAGRAGGFAEGIEELELFADADDQKLLLEGYFARGTPRSKLRQWADNTRTLLPEISGFATFHSETSHFDQTSASLPVVTAGAGDITYTTSHSNYRVSAGAFFQANRLILQDLVALVTAGRIGRLALDLYAGVGLFSTVLAKTFAQVIAVEASPTSHADLLYNSPANVKAVRATTGQYLMDAGGKQQPDLVVVDPPRAGLGESVAKHLGKMGAPQLVYVSCDPATLARDLTFLRAGGYRIEQAHLIDLFPQTYHIESVFHLVR